MTSLKSWNNDFTFSIQRGLGLENEFFREVESEIRLDMGSISYKDE